MSTGNTTMFTPSLCPDTTAPININTSTAVTCTLKCEFTFNYKDSHCSATNQGDYISLSYDTTASGNVVYNLNNYTVREVRIYHKSLHTFNSGQKSDGEMIIVHDSISGKEPLFVCIPIKKDDSASLATEKLSKILNNVKSLANNVSGTTGVIPDVMYNLNSFVPKKPFYMYIASEPFTPCLKSNTNYIVFPPTSETTIFMNKSDYDDILTKVIKQNTYAIKTNKIVVSYNSKGPVTSKTDDQIYIDCQPVGQSESTKTVVTNKSDLYSTFDSKSVLNNIFFQLILGAFVFVLFIMIVYKFLDIVKVKRGSLKGGFLGQSSFINSS